MNAIELKNVSKRYHKSEYYFSKKDLFWALKDISFSLEKGKTLGIIGPNGAGKTTIIRLLSKITFPTEGTVLVRGEVVPLISMVGALNYLLTGRENILFLTAALGIKKADRKRIFQDIIEFSGLSDFIDMQTKKYSSGMASRLSFSIAVHAPSDILLIDESLAVGDEEFRKKCFAKIDQFQKEGRTLVFVSHDLDSIKRICDRAIWLGKGGIVKEGLPDKVIDSYLKRHTIK